MYDKRGDKYNNNPGPGTYESKEERMQGVKIGEKLRNREPEDQPGPGNYEMQSKIAEGPKYSIMSKRGQKYNNNPGPGTYEAKNLKSKPMTMGGKLKNREPEEVPGPGNYEASSKIREGPEYSMQ